MIEEFQKMLEESETGKQLDIPAMVRWLLRKGIEYAGEKNLTREKIAELMSQIIGLDKDKKITKTMVDKWTREKNPVRFPLEFSHAFCIATEDYRLACLIPHILGLKVLENEKTLRTRLEKTELIIIAAQRKMKILREQLEELKDKKDNLIPIFKLEA